MTLPDALASPLLADLARMQHFHALNQQQQGDAIRRLAGAGQRVSTIAVATRLSVEQMARVLAEAQA